ncbi:MAG: DUF3299 domain-containing protein [Planctomycetota bacterium]
METSVQPADATIQPGGLTSSASGTPGGVRLEDRSLTAAPIDPACGTAVGTKPKNTRRLRNFAILAVFGFAVGGMAALHPFSHPVAKLSPVIRGQTFDQLADTQDAAPNGSTAATTATADGGTQTMTLPAQQQSSAGTPVSLNADPSAATPDPALASAAPTTSPRQAATESISAVAAGPMTKKLTADAGAITQTGAAGKTTPAGNDAPAAEPVRRLTGPSPAAAGGYAEISFAKLGGWYYQPEYPKDYPAELKTGPVQPKIPDSIMALSGTRISIEGYMVPLMQDGDHVKMFILCKVLPTCCFGCHNRLNDWIAVTVPDGMTVSYCGADPIRVEGTLRVGVVEQDGDVLNIYRMRADKIFPPKDAE